jgi:transposase InsO family protein
LPQARDGSLYFVTYTDEASNYSVVVNLRSKADTLTSFKNVLARMERASGSKLKALRTDGGGEYTSAAFKCYLLDKGIDHIITAPGTPQDNGGAERKN